MLCHKNKNILIPTRTELPKLFGMSVPDSRSNQKISIIRLSGFQLESLSDILCCNACCIYTRASMTGQGANRNLMSRYWYHNSVSNNLPETGGQDRGGGQTVVGVKSLFLTYFVDRKERKTKTTAFPNKIMCLTSRRLSRNWFVLDLNPGLRPLQPSIGLSDIFYTAAFVFHARPRK